MYERFALGARFFFALLAIVFVVRAWLITVRDNRRARTIRAWLPETGTVGEWLVLNGGGQAKRGAKYPILREGLIGSSWRADVRVKHPDVSREHAYFEATEDGLLLRPIGSSPAMVERGAGGAFYPSESGELALGDGDILAIGKLRVMLTLFSATGTFYRAPRPPIGREAPLDDRLDEILGVPMAEPLPEETEWEHIWQDDANPTPRR